MTQQAGLREAATLVAMHALITNPTWVFRLGTLGDNDPATGFAKAAVSIADAVLKELANDQHPSAD